MMGPVGATEVFYQRNRLGRDDAQQIMGNSGFEGATDEELAVPFICEGSEPNGRVGSY